MISRTVKVRIFPYFKILNFRSDDVTFLRNAETAILTKNERENTTILVALTITTIIVIEKQQQIAGIAENVPSCNYCAATIVARPLRATVKGEKPAFRIRRKSRLASLIQWIQESGRVSGLKLLACYKNF